MTEDSEVHRRSVLRGAMALGVVGLGGTLSGCGGGSSKSASSNSTPTASAPTSAAPTATSPGSASAGGTVLGPVSGVPVGGGEVFATQKVVVTQPTAGEYKGFTAVCTHEGCIVDDVSGSTINCACHGSKYSITDGSVVQGPAQRPLAAENVSVSDGTIRLG
jgi:Rieske Fe-S protein